MNCISSFIIILLLTLTSFVGYATKKQEYGNTELKFKHLQVEQGLSSNVTSCILQDSKGFLWFGTDAGLNRYDGFQIKIYKSFGKENNTLSNGVIKCLFEDSQGMIWIGTERGLNCYNPQTDQFRFFLSSKEDSSSLSNNTITSIVEDKFHNLWIGTFNGLNKLLGYNNEGKARFLRYQHDSHNIQSLSNNRIFCLSLDKEGKLWIGTEGGGLNLVEANQLQENNLVFTHFIHSPTKPNSIADNIIYNIYQVKDGRLYIGTDKGLSVMVRKNGEYHFYNYPKTVKEKNKFKEHKVFSICQDQVDQIWIGTFGDGLIQLQPDEKYQIHRHEPYNPQSLSRDFIYSIYSSREGILWLATRETGIDRIDPKLQQFSHLKHNPNDKNSLSNNVIKAIVEGPDGRFWFGTYGGGLNVYNPKTNQYRSYKHSAKNPNSPSSNIIETLVFDHLNRLWIGTSKGLNLFEPEKKKFTRFEYNPSNPNSLANNNIWFLLPSRDQKGLWIATYNGLDKYDWEENKFYHFQNDPNDPGSLSFNFTRAILEDEQHKLWVSTWGGGLDMLDLKKYSNLKEAKFEHYRHNPDKTNSISSDLVNTTFVDHYGRLWVGTQGGLNLFRKEYGDFIRYTENEGLVDNVVKGILEDEQGFLWISTQKGMSRFSPSTGEFNNYDHKDGLQGDIFNLSSCLLNSKGEMMFGGNNGISIFHPESITERTDFPPVYISQLKINNQLIQTKKEFNGRPILSQALEKQETIHLKYDENTLSIEFSAIEYSSPEKIRFSFFLEGADNKWNQTDFQNRQITYSGLKPGKYRFHVKATNFRGDWSVQDAQLNFHIHPPLWATKSAISLYILLGLGFLAYLGYNFLNRIKMQKELQREKEEHQRRIEINQFKLKFFTNISHEIRTPLTLISGPLQKILAEADKISSKQKRAYLETIDRNVQILLRLVNQLLDFRKIENEVASLQLEEIDLGRFLGYCSESFKASANKKGIQLNYIAPPSQCSILIDRDKFEKIIYNLLSNALKYTPSGKSIELSLHLPGKMPLPYHAPNDFHSSDFICFQVRDTGIGIPMDQIDFIFDRYTQIKQNSLSEIGTGIGLALTKSLVEAHHGFISVKSTIGEGSSFYIWLPSSKSFYSDEEIVTDEPTEISLSKPVVEEHTNIDQKQEDQFSMETIEKSKEQTILIVEDHPDMRSFIKDSLQHKYNILEAENGKEGLEKALTEGPDIVITDVMMPVMDGLEFCQRLKKNINISHTPVIMLTAKNSLEHELEGLGKGADHYLSKPFHMGQLQLVVRNLLDARKKMQLKFSGTRIPSPKEITVTSADETFFQKANEIIETNISDSEFSVELLAQETGLSSVHLYRKLKSITGMSTNQYIRSFRLKRAAQLLKQNKLRVSEVAYSVGFNDPKYFRKCFKNEFGKSPSEYAASIFPPENSEDE